MMKPNLREYIGRAVRVVIDRPLGSRQFYVYSRRNDAIVRPMYQSCRRGDPPCAQASLAVVDATSGTNRSLPIASQAVSNPAALLLILSDGKSIIYIAADGLYISALDDRPPAKVADGATSVWLLNP